MRHHIVQNSCISYNYLYTDAVSSPPTGWLFKKPSDNHDTFLDADSNMNLFELTDQVQIPVLLYIIVDLKTETHLCN